MRWRLVAAFVGITIVVLAAHDIPLRRHLQQVERDRLVTGLERDSFVLAGRVEESLESGSGRGDTALQHVIDAYRASSGARVVITDRNGIAVAISDEETSAGTSYVTRPEIASGLGGSLVAGERDSTTLGFRLLYVAVPVLSGESVVGTVRLTYPAAGSDVASAGESAACWSWLRSRSSLPQRQRWCWPERFHVHCVGCVQRPTAWRAET